MPRNGSGQYNLVYDWNDDKANGIKVLASRMQGQDEDIGTAITGSLASDGQTPLTGDLDFNNNKATDLSDGSDLGDSVNVSQVQTGEVQYYGVSSTISGGTDGEDYDIPAFATLLAYPVYTRFSFTCHFTCIDDPVARLDALATKTLVKSDGADGYSALEEGDMIADKEYIAVYNEDIDNTQIIIENPELPSDAQKATTTSFGQSYLSNRITISSGTDADHDIDFSAGNFQFDDGSGQAVSSALTKSIDSTWAEGNNQGGLDTGSVANDTTYYMLAIYNPTSQTADFLFSTSVDSPTMPSGYTKKKRIAALRTDGSANIRPGKYYFNPDGSYRFQYNSNITDVNVTSITTGSRTLYPLTVPPSFIAVFTFKGFTNTNSVGTKTIYITDPNQTETTTPTFKWIQGQVEDESVVAYLECGTDSSSQIGIRGDNSDPDIDIYTRGWIDYNL